MKHFNVLTTVLVLIAGVWAIVEFRQRSRSFPKSGLGGLWLFLIFFNAAELAVFFSIYWESNLTPAQLASLSSWYKLVEWPILTVLVLGVHISLYRAIFRRRDRDFEAPTGRCGRDSHGTSRWQAWPLRCGSTKSGSSRIRR